MGKQVGTSLPTCTDELSNMYGRVRQLIPTKFHVLCNPL